MPLDRMVRKAYELVVKKRVERVGNQFYNAVGEHGTYAVARQIDGTVSCSCPGFARKGRCSHSLAVMIMNDLKLLRTVEREYRKMEKNSVHRT